MGKLFEPIRIGNVEIPNRVVKSAMVEGFADGDGRLSPAIAQLYERWARGGVGLAITGMMSVKRGHGLTDHEAGLFDDSQIAPLRHLVAAAHRHGGRVFVQLCHAPPQILRRRARVVGARAPSGGLNRINYLRNKALSVEEIEQLVTAFGEAATRVRAAGADGLQLHAAHGYLLSRFISPRHNRRKDAWGGDFERRLAFLEAVYRSVRQAVGDDFPVTIKLNAHDGRRDGLALDDAVEVGRRLEAWGIDAIEVSAGTGDEGLGFYANRGEIPVDLSKRFLRRELPFLRPLLPAMGPIMRSVAGQVALEQEGYFLSEARRFTAALKVPVIAVGGIRSLQAAEEALARQDAAMIAMARPLVAQPELVRAWQQGRQQRATCTSCNRCFVQIGLGERLHCTGFRQD